jgi:hypothetical protein
LNEKDQKVQRNFKEDIGVQTIVQDNYAWLEDNELQRESNLY